MKLKTKVAALLLVLMASYAPTQAQIASRIHGTTVEEEIILDIKHVGNGETVQVGVIYRNNDDEQADAVIMTTDATGNTVWRRRLTTQFADLLYRVTIAANGDYIAVGYTTQNNGGMNQRKGLVCRYQPNGTLVWSHEWAPPTAVYQNDLGPIYKGVRELANGDIVAVGSVNDDRPGGAAIVTMFDNLGNQVWNRLYEHAGSNAFYDVIEFGGEIVVCGYTDDGGTSRDGVLVRLDNLGNQINTHGYSLSFNYWPNATDSIILDCVHFKNLHVFGGRLFVAGDVMSDWVFLPNGDNGLMMAIDAAWNGLPTVVSNPPNFSSSCSFFIPTGVNEFLVGQNPGATYYGHWGITSPTNDFLLTRLNAGAVVQSVHPAETGEKFLFAADVDVPNNGFYAAGLLRGGTIQIGQDDAYNSYNTLPFKNETQCKVDQPLVLVARPEVVNDTPVWQIRTNLVNEDNAVLHVALNLQTMDPCDSTFVPVDTNGGCDDKCYWKLTGNNITMPNNIFGTLTNDDIRFFSSNAQRGVLKDNGYWGINEAAPATTLNVDCTAPGGPAVSGLKFDNLPQGDGNALVIDGNGYVHVAQSYLYKQGGGGNNSDMQSQIDELKKQVEELKDMLGQGTGQQTGATLSVAPNPTNGEFAATYSITQPYSTGEIKITDATGKTLMTKPLENNNTNGTIRVSLPKTIASEQLICTLICDGKVIASQKMVLINK